MRRISAKKRKRDREARPFREQLLIEVGRCEICGNRWIDGLIVHEIARGFSRSAALDKRYAVLVVCNGCHDKVDGWTRIRQLRVLKRSRPADYDLVAFNKLVGYGENRITEEDVEREMPNVI